MARLDYYAIETAIKTLLEADATLAGTVVTVEDELLFGAERTPWVGIFLDRRDPGEQSLSAGTRTRYNIRLSIWCWEYSMESISKAIQLRDDLVGKVEVALMKQRTLNDTVTKSWIEGGELPSARVPDNNGFVSGGEIILIADASATTT